MNPIEINFIYLMLLDRKMLKCMMMENIRKTSDYFKNKCSFIDFYDGEFKIYRFLFKFKSFLD